MKYFNDYLNLKNLETSQYDFIIFYGENNVGKSSYINFLNTKNEYVLDEIWKISHLFLLSKVKHKTSTVFVASKLNQIYFLFFFIFFKVKFVNLNNCSMKIKSELEKRNIDYNEESIRTFIEKYNSSYENLDKILELYPSNSFTYSLKMYLHKNEDSMESNLVDVA